jgi:hypothetical protein
MLIATFKSSDKAYTVDYAMGWNRKSDAPDRREPYVLQGEPAMMDHYARNWNDFASPYLAIAASCSERLDVAQSFEFWTRLRDLYLPGLRPGQLATLGVHHRESSLFADSRSAVHGFIGRTCLYTGRFFQPYYHGSRDAYRVELGQELLNLSQGWSSPKDPGKARVAVGSGQGPGKAEQQARIVEFTQQFRLFSDEDLHDRDAIGVALMHGGAWNIKFTTTKRGYLRISFRCRDHHGLEMTMNIVLHPDRREKQLEGSMLRELIGPRLRRTPELFARMKAAFLTELAFGREELDRRLGSSALAYDRVMTWANGLELAQPNRPERITEVFDRIPLLRAPVFEESDSDQVQPMALPTRPARGPIGGPLSLDITT